MSDEKKPVAKSSVPRTVFLTVELYFMHGAEYKRYYMRNFTWEKIKSFRETVFNSGFMFSDPDDPEHYFVVSPWNIKSIEVTKQKKFFQE